MTHITRPSEAFSYDDIRNDIAAFEALLKTNGISIQSGGPLEHVLLLLDRVCSTPSEKATHQDWPTFHQDLRDAVGAFEIIKLILLNRENPEIAGIVPHLRLLNEGAMTQTSAARGIDDASNKLFELYIALGALRVGSNVGLDDPQSSTGKNPDIICRMLDGRTWGFACKVPFGIAPMSLFNLIEKGFEQIDRSSVDTGIVTISFKNNLPHDRLFPQFGIDASGNVILGSYDECKQLLDPAAGYIVGRVREMINHVTREEVWKTVRRRKALPGFLAAASVAVSLKTQHGRPPSLISFLVPIPFHELSPIVHPPAFDGINKRVLEELNVGLHIASPPLIILP